MDILESINKKLAVMGESYDELKPFLQTYLQRIETITNEREKTRTEAIDVIKQSSFNVSDISKQLGCSRTTLYNHDQLLKRYIELSVEWYKKSDPFAILDNYRTELSKMQEQIALMENRDIDFELLRHENSLLIRNNNNLSAEVERLQARIHELSGELHSYKTKSAKTDSHTLK